MSEVRDLTHWTDWTDGELIDQAAGACQDRALLECDYVREAIALNVIAPFRQKLTTLRAENGLMREALENVVHPLLYLQRKAESEGARLGGQAYQIANDLPFVQSIARNALAQVAK